MWQRLDMQEKSVLFTGLNAIFIGITSRQFSNKIKEQVPMSKTNCKIKKPRFMNALKKSSTSKHSVNHRMCKQYI